MKKRIRINKKRKKELMKLLGKEKFEKLMKAIRIYSEKRNAIDLINEGSFKEIQNYLSNNGVEYIIEKETLHTLIRNLQKID